MDFARPAYLALLAALLPLGALALVHLERRRRAALRAFGDPALLARSSTLPVPRRRLAAEALALLALCLLLLALARPQFGEKPVVLTRTGRDVLFVLDLSRSMNAEDVPPSRLGAAKRAIREIVETSPGDRIGLAVFGGSGFLQVPLTLDRAAFDLFLNAAATDDLSDPGTDLADALETAATAFGRDSEPRYRVAVVLSDGESLRGDVESGLEALRRSGVRAFTVGIGTPAGAPIPLRAGERLLGYHRDSAGQVVVSRLQEGVLRGIAHETGGAYLRLGAGGSVSSLAAELAQLERREISSRSFTELVDRYQWPLGLALAALAAEWLVARPRRGPRAAFVPLLGLAALAGAPLHAQEAREGERLYREGRFQEAYDAFQRGVEEQGPSPALAYDSGNALYRMGRYDAAGARFREALSGPPGLRARGSYNMGNALVRSAEGGGDARAALRRAIQAYEQALLLDARDGDAKWNLELALRKLEREEERQQRRSQAGGEGGGGGERRESGGGGGGKGEDGRGEGQAVGETPEGSERDRPQRADDGSGAQALTEEQARQLLEAVGSEEGDVLENRNRGRASVSSGDRDW